MKRHPGTLSIAYPVNGVRQTKLFECVDGRVSKATTPLPALWRPEEVVCESLDDVMAATALAGEAGAIILRGLWRPSVLAAGKPARRRVRERVEDGQTIPATLEDAPVHFLVIDADNTSASEGVDPRDPAAAADDLLRQIEADVPELRGCDVGVQFSASHAMPANGATDPTTYGRGLKAHLFVWLEEPMTCAEAVAWAHEVNRRAGKQVVDPAALRPAQPIYVAPPMCRPPITDPFRPSERSFIRRGERRAVALPRPDMSAAPIRGARSGGGGGAPVGPSPAEWWGLDHAALIRECLGFAGIHPVLRTATMRLVRERGPVAPGSPEEAEIIAETLRLAREVDVEARGRSRADLEARLEGVPDLVRGAVALVAADRAADDAALADADAPVRYPEYGVTLAEAERALEDVFAEVGRQVRAANEAQDRYARHLALWHEWNAERAAAWQAMVTEEAGDDDLL